MPAGRVTCGPGTADGGLSFPRKVATPRTAAIFWERRAPMCGRISRMTEAARSPEISECSLATASVVRDVGAAGFTVVELVSDEGDLPTS